MATKVKEYVEIYRTDDGPEDYKEEFKGKVITVLAKRKNAAPVVMPRRDAAQFLGQYVPFDRERSLGEKPLASRPWKGKLPEVKTEEDRADLPFQNVATGKTFATKEELDDDLKGLEHLRLKEDD